VERGLYRPHWSYFLRADTMHTLYSYLEDNPARGGQERFHELSHGEGFLEILRTRVNQPGGPGLHRPEVFSSPLRPSGPCRLNGGALTSAS
jgi:predicted ATPase